MHSLNHPSPAGQETPARRKPPAAVLSPTAPRAGEGSAP
jgi:hypothetical protein